VVYDTVQDISQYVMLYVTQSVIQVYHSVLDSMWYVMLRGTLYGLSGSLCNTVENIIISLDYCVI
jgi:hypothetical protein